MKQRAVWINQHGKARRPRRESSEKILDLYAFLNLLILSVAEGLRDTSKHRHRYYKDF